jgi:hypothetical protein
MTKIILTIAAIALTTSTAFAAEQPATVTSTTKASGKVEKAVPAPTASAPVATAPAAKPATVPATAASAPAVKK